jgi:uncharacterized protein
MTHHRENFERVYALAEKVAPDHLLGESSEDEADRFMIQKEISFSGLSRLNRTQDSYFRGTPFGRANQIIEDLLADGGIIEVKVEAWTPVERSTIEETVFLAPLDPVSARGRAKILFGFDYVWEVYKPEHKRRFGYYTLPVLWGDRLVARFDSKLDRTSNIFAILGFWLEDKALGKDEVFAEALAGGFGRFVSFLGASELVAEAIQEPLLQSYVSASIKSN